MSGLFSAIGFLTIIPVRKQNINPETIFFFPVVGLLLGGIITLAHLLIARFISSNIYVISALLLAIYTTLTGGLHLDGLSDTVDGLLGGKGDKTKILSIMDDGHIGAAGTIAIVLDILIKFVLLAEVVKSSRAWLPLLIFPVISRWAMVFSMTLSQPAKNDGLGKLFIENTKIWNFIAASLLSLIICLYTSIITGFAILVASVGTIFLTLYFKRRINGMTGDTFGAINEIAEIISLFVLKALGK